MNNKISTIRSGDWDLPKHKLNRAYQALHGLLTHANAFNFDLVERHKIQVEITKKTLLSLSSVEKSIEAQPDEEIGYYVSDIIECCIYEASCAVERTMFVTLLRTINDGIDYYNLWDIYFNHYDFQHFQLRINKHVFIDNFNFLDIESLLDKPKNYIVELPNFSEILIESSQTYAGLKLIFSIPIRTYIVDYFVLLNDAERCRSMLSDIAKRELMDSKINNLRDKIDSYARQMIILSITILEAIINDFSWFFDKITKDAEIKKELKKYAQGVTPKLLNYPLIWIKALNVEIAQPDCIVDMKKIIEVRNRLVHLNVNNSSLHAFDLDIYSIQIDKEFSDRILPFLKKDEYSGSFSEIGYEIEFTKFCLATLNEILCFFNTIFYKSNTVKWLDLPLENGMLDIDENVKRIKSFEYP